MDFAAERYARLSALGRRRVVRLVGRDDRGRTRRARRAARRPRAAVAGVRLLDRARLAEAEVLHPRRARRGLPAEVGARAVRPVPPSPRISWSSTARTTCSTAAWTRSHRRLRTCWDERHAPAQCGHATMRHAQSRRRAMSRGDVRLAALILSPRCWSPAVRSRPTSRTTWTRWRAARAAKDAAFRRAGLAGARRRAGEVPAAQLLPGRPGVLGARRVPREPARQPPAGGDADLRQGAAADGADWRPRVHDAGPGASAVGVQGGRGAGRPALRAVHGSHDGHGDVPGGPLPRHLALAAPASTSWTSTSPTTRTATTTRRTTARTRRRRTGCRWPSAPARRSSDDARPRPLQAIVFDFDGVLADTERLHLARVPAGAGTGRRHARHGRLLRPLPGLRRPGRVRRARAATAGLAWTDDDVTRLVAGEGRLLPHDSRDAAGPVRRRGRTRPRMGGRRAVRHRVGGAARTKSSSSSTRPDCGPSSRSSWRRAKRPTSSPRRIRTSPRCGSSARSRARSVAVEDSVWGIESARQAGMKVVAVTSSYPRERLTGADAVVDRFSDLTLGVFEGLVRRGRQRQRTVGSRQ